MTGDVRLRDVTEDDLPLFFDHQLDPVANVMAAFAAEDPADWVAFRNHWAKILGDGRITARTILVGGRVAGYVASFERAGEPEVGYWVGRDYWGRGVATSALARFLAVVTTRPLFARVAGDHRASIRVLEKCGFAVCGQGRAFANARGREIDELILRLDADAAGGAP